MKSSEIVDTSRRPLNPASGGLYSNKTKEVLDAILRTGAVVEPTIAITRIDRSVYEFPGDQTYARYLRSS
jgi:hypothetical protein